MWRTKPRRYSAAAVYRNRDGQPSFRADTQAFRIRTYRDVIYEVWRIGLKVDDADHPAPPSAAPPLPWLTVSAKRPSAVICTL